MTNKGFFSVIMLCTIGCLGGNFLRKMLTTFLDACMFLLAFRLFLIKQSCYESDVVTDGCEISVMFTHDAEAFFQRVVMPSFK